MTNHNYFVVITAKVLLDKTLSDKQKLLIGLISNLSNERGYCFASNKYLADSLCCSESTIRQHIQDLEEANYLGRVLKVNEKGELEFRSLTVLDPPAEKSAPPCRISSTPPAEKSAHNNKEDNNKENIGNKLPLVEKEKNFLIIFNKITGRDFKKLDDKSKRQFSKLLKEGFHAEDFKKAILKALTEMTKRARQGYLTPEFITRYDEFNKYLNMPEIPDIPILNHNQFSNYTPPQTINHDNRA